MTRYLALLRAVNVGGTGKLPKADLRGICEDLGFDGVRTYIQTGNLIFETDRSRAEADALLREGLNDRLNTPFEFALLSRAEITAIRDANPFPNAAAARVAVLVPTKPFEDDATEKTGHTDEEIVPTRAAIYVHYPSGMGSSSLKLSATKSATARNMNTVERLVEMLSD